MRSSLRWPMAGLVVLPMLCGGTAAYGAKATVITFYEACAASDPAYKATDIARQRFEAVHPDIKVKILPGTGLDRILAATAAGLAPDSMMVDGPVITSMVMRKILRPIDDFIQRDHVSAADYWAPSWREAVWKGKVYAMAWGTDANFGLYWNRKQFAEAGIAAPAKTVSELETMLPKLSKRNATGNFTRVGMIPWGFWGYSNSLYTWGWVFGGEFYNPDTKKVTPDDPKVVKALTWLYEQANVNGGLSKFASVSKDPNAIFATGNASMSANNSQGIAYLTKYPNVDYGIAPMPVADGVTEDPTWVGGWKVGMLPYTKHPSATWQWLKFMTADPKGTQAACESLSWFPGYKKSDLYKAFEEQPAMASFTRILERASHQRPVMPANDEYATALNDAVAKVMSGSMDAKSAFAQCRVDVQKKLDYYLGRYK